jgi:hypothetical protein
LRVSTGGNARAPSLGGTQRLHWELCLCEVFVLADDHSVGCFFIKVNKTAIAVISAHARLISAMPIFLLGFVFACYGCSAFYYAVDQTKSFFFF